MRLMKDGGVDFSGFEMCRSTTCVCVLLSDFPFFTFTFILCVRRKMKRVFETETEGERFCSLLYLLFYLALIRFRVCMIMNL